VAFEDDVRRAVQLYRIKSDCAWGAKKLGHITRSEYEAKLDALNTELVVAICTLHQSKARQLCARPRPVEYLRLIR
jgi:hypothetical protein